MFVAQLPPFAGSGLQSYHVVANAGSQIGALPYISADTMLAILSLMSLTIADGGFEEDADDSGDAADSYCRAALAASCLGDGDG